MIDNQKLKNDFYAAVNAEWLQRAQIPKDKARTGAFNEIDNRLEKILRADADLWLRDLKKAPKNDIIQEFIKFYGMFKNYQKRQKDEKPALQALLKKVDAINSFSALNALVPELIKNELYLPFELGVASDFIDSQKQVLYFGGPSLLLPEKSYYEKQKEKVKWQNLYRLKSLELLKALDFESAEALAIINGALRFDEKLVPLSQSATERADYVKQYNPMALAAVDQKLGLFDLAAICQSLVKQKVDTIVITYPPFLEKFDSLFNEHNFADYKKMLILDLIYKASPYLSEKVRLLGVSFHNQLFGIEKAYSAPKHAFLVAKSFFNMPLGLQYAHDHFGLEAKKDVEQMVFAMIAIYQQRLQKNEWLSEPTKTKAILKLSKLEPLIGFPSEIRPYYQKLIVKNSKQSDSLLANAWSFRQIISEYQFSKYLQPINKKLWGMSPATVNAYFHPSRNQIVFPAAILQAPFYDPKANSSTNFGGIGAVIAHEISHAFDNNGAQFDENGNLNLWWTPEDHQSFKLKTEEMIELFEGKETEFGQCQGKLTVSENIADSGGIACAFAAAKKRDDFDAPSFFINHARVWRAKFKADYAKMLLQSDVHAPAKLRANLQLSNFSPFLETFEIKAGDKMYLAPEKRVKIW